MKKTNKNEGKKLNKIEKVQTFKDEFVDENNLTNSNNDNLINKSQEKIKKVKKLKVKKKKFQTKQADAIRYDSKITEGLSTKIVEERIVNGLTNKVNEKYNKSIFSIIFSNTFTFFNLLCLIVLIAYLIVDTDLMNFAFILPFAANLVIGIFQEIKAKISVDKLSILQAPQTIVVRDGKEEEILSDDIVLDDIIKMTAGDQIPCDSFVKSGYVEVNESLITGESVPVKKNIGDALMAGSFITSGNCYAIADKVSSECYVQKLTSKAKKFRKPNSELMNTLNWIIRIVGILIIPIAIGIGLVNYKTPILEDGETLAHFVVARTGPVILGMIPAGLILLTTIALSLGVIRLFRRKTLVQDMFSLEMLARVDVLCLDKTGTITDGRMQVVDEVILNEKFPYNLNDIIGTMENVLDDTNQTAIALRSKYIPNKEFSITKTLPFSSARKYSAVQFEGAGTFGIGAPEFVLKELTDSLKSIIHTYTVTGNRVLMLVHSDSPITNKELLPNNVKPIALIVLSDNIREEAINTIKWFKDNQVQVKVISGDNPITVSEIAKRAGIENASNWISLEGLSDKEVASVADKYTVFGRVSPDQKAVLMKALKRSGHTVAMTGDGVNDILAMREADCSITVASGADAAKNIAHIVLVDNNFNSMPRVVAEGRRVINNIQQSASLFLMKTIFITLLGLISIATTVPFPFESGMLTMLELLIIGLASFMLSLQPNEKRVEGDFLYTIISNAIPGALILLLNVYLVKLLNAFGFFPTNELSTTLQVICFTLGGVVYLYRLCKPYNGFRTFLVLLVICCIVIWLVFLLEFFGLVNIFPINSSNWQFLFIIIAIVEFDLLLVNKIFEINKKITDSFSKNQLINLD